MFLQCLLFQTSMSFCQTTGAIGVQNEKYYYVSFLRITTLYIIGGGAETMLISFYGLSHH